MSSPDYPNIKFLENAKLKKGDAIGIVSPSFGAPGEWPHVYMLALERVRNIFGLSPVEFSSTKKVNATSHEKSEDLKEAFLNTGIKAIIASLGGNDQKTYIHNLPKEPFCLNPKMFFGFSDNTHFANFLWLNGISSYYGASLFTQFGMQKKMDDFTIKYLNYAFFEKGVFELLSSPIYNDIDLDWDNPDNLNEERIYEKNQGWLWDGDVDAIGVSWGGCLESIHELLQQNIKIPTLEQFENVILFFETSEEIPTAEYVSKVLELLGDRGILISVKGVLVGRPKAWQFNIQKTTQEKEDYRQKQRIAVLNTIRKYNRSIPVIQNMDFGHTDPQIPLPNGRVIRINSLDKRVYAEF